VARSKLADSEGGLRWLSSDDEGTNMCSKAHRRSSWSRFRAGSFGAAQRWQRLAIGMAAQFWAAKMIVGGGLYRGRHLAYRGWTP
jgi:hypothetical protein